ncbi:hypothetical protein FRC09_019380 [Ceratobasidium sp. 395]|nr:hypothetical protein FRC09_019380 [Ceratobasidium sp. 395]
MPGPSGSTPSTTLQAQRAQGDAIEELKRKYSRISETVTKLENDLDEAKKANKSLARKFEDLEENCQDLTSQLEEALEEQRDLQRFRARATRLLRALAAGQTLDEIQNQLVTQAISSGDANAYLAALNTLGDEDDGEEEEDEQHAGGNDEGHTPGPGAPETYSQEEIVDAALFKKTVNSCLFHLYGAVGSLKPEHMGYPEGLAPGDEAWPSEGTGASRRALIRFDFSKRHDEPVNVEPFKTWCKFVRDRGAERVPNAQSVLAQASEDTIQKRCALKYQYEADKYKTYVKAQARAVEQARRNQEQARRNQEQEEASSDGDTADDGEQRVPDEKKKRTAAYRARTTGATTVADLTDRFVQKMNSRRRRMESLPADQYSEMQRATMLTPGAQSQDETDYEVGEDGARRKTNQFKTRAWPFLSDEFVAMKKAIDAIADPSPPRGYQARVPGLPREGDPPRNKMNEQLLRVWMVKPDVLTANPEWIRTRRVIPNDDPIRSEKPNKRRRSGNSGGEIVPQNQIRSVRRKLQGAKTALEDTLGGKTYDRLQEDLGVAEEDDGEGEGVGGEGAGGDGGAD